MDKDILMLFGLLLIRLKKRGPIRKIWVKRWLAEVRKSLSHTKLIELLLDDPNDYRNYLRMDESNYTYILQLVTPIIEKKNTTMRDAITPHERLSATLRFLATGRSYTDLKYSCGISKQSLSKIIPETCLAICKCLQKEYIKFPSTPQEWIRVSKEFEDKWQYPHCLGSVDGKHVRIIPPADSGSYYYNYKGSHSIVLMAVVNANLEFLMVDVGTNGRISDGGVIGNTEFYRRLQNNALNLPTPNLEATDRKSRLNYVFVGDEAFTLRQDFMKPFNQRELTPSRRIYNYRHSRCRRIVENAFGILASRFHIFSKPINLRLEVVDIVVLACCTLHNFLRKRNPQGYTPSESLDFEDVQHRVFTPGQRTDDNNLIDLAVGRNRNHSAEAKIIRDQFREYFCAEGAVPWQYDMAKVAENDVNTDADVIDDLLEEQAVDDVEPLASGDEFEEEQIEMDIDISV